MANKDRVKINYAVPERLWVKIKQYNILLDNKDLCKTIDDLCKKGIASYENERK